MRQTHQIRRPQDAPEARRHDSDRGSPDNVRRICRAAGHLRRRPARVRVTGAWVGETIVKSDRTRGVAAKLASGELIFPTAAVHLRLQIPARGAPPQTYSQPCAKPRGFLYIPLRGASRGIQTSPFLCRHKSHVRKHACCPKPARLRGNACVAGGRWRPAGPCASAARSGRRGWLACATWRLGKRSARRSRTCSATGAGRGGHRITAGAVAWSVGRREQAANSGRPIVDGQQAANGSRRPINSRRPIENSA